MLMKIMIEIKKVSSFMNILIDDRQSVREIEESIIKNIEIAIGEVLKYEKESMDSEISISFVEKEEIKELNREYRNIDEVTDVLSFPIEEEFLLTQGPKLLGDVIISVEKAKEQSIEYNHSFEREMVYLTVHSIFHLLGYDHIDEKDKQIMRRKEKDIMNTLNIKCE